MVTLSDDEDDGLEDPIRLFNYKQNRVLKHSEIKSFTIKDFGYVEEFDIHPEDHQSLLFDKDNPLVQKRLSGDAKPLEEYSNTNTKAQNSERIAENPIGGEVTNLKNLNIHVSAIIARVEKQLDTSKMAKRSYDVHRAKPTGEINFKKHISLTGLKFVQKGMIVDHVLDDNLCESSKNLKRKACDSLGVRSENVNFYENVYERIIGETYQKAKSNAMHLNTIQNVRANENTNNVKKVFNDGCKQLGEANRDSIMPKKVRRSKSLHITPSDSLIKCTVPGKINLTNSKVLKDKFLQNSKAVEDIKKTEKIDVNTSKRPKLAKISKEKNSIAAVIQTKKVITNDITKSCSKEKHKLNKTKLKSVIQTKKVITNDINKSCSKENHKLNETKLKSVIQNKKVITNDIKKSFSKDNHKLNETKLKVANTNCNTKVTESHLTVSKVALSIPKKRRNTICADRAEDKITSKFKVCDKKVFGGEAIIPHYHRLSFDNKIENLKGIKIDVDKRRTSLDLPKKQSLVNQEKIQSNNRRYKDIDKNHKGDLNTQLISQSCLPKKRVIRNNNTGTIEPINLINNISSSKSIPLNNPLQVIPVKPQRHRNSDKNISNHGIKMRSLSQSNLPLITVPTNTNNGVKESLKLNNISSIQAGHLHNPSQVNSEVADTHIINKKNINKTHKDDINTRSLSQSNLTNENNGFKVSIPLNGIPSLEALFLRNKSQVNSEIAQPHIINKKNINKTHKDDIKKQTLSQLNLPLLALPTNERNVVKESLELNNISSLQAVHLHNPSQVNSEVADKHIINKINVNKTHKDNINTKSLSQFNLPLTAVPTNEHNGVKESIPFNDIPSLQAMSLHSTSQVNSKIAQTPIINKTNINKTHKDELNMQSLSQSNLPSLTVPSNERNGVKESLKLNNISSIQAGHLHNPSQANSEVEDTHIINKKDINKTHNDDINKRSLSQSNLLLIPVPTNVHNGVKESFKLINVSSLQAVHLHNPSQVNSEIARTNTIVIKDINKTHKDDLNMQSLSQSNLPLLAVPANEHNGVKESLKLNNISSLQAVHLHNPSQVNSKIVQTPTIMMKNKNKTYKDDLKMQSLSQSNLPSITVPTNEHNGVKESFKLINISSLQALHLHNPSQVNSKIARTHTIVMKDINKTHKDDIKTRSQSQSNLPLITVPKNENNGAKVSIPINNNPSQVVAQTHVNNNKNINETPKDSRTTTTQPCSQSILSLNNETNGAIEPILLKNTLTPKPLLLCNKIQQNCERTSDVINLPSSSQSNLPLITEPTKLTNNSRPKAIPQLEPFQENYSNVNVNLSRTLNKGIDVLTTDQEINGGKYNPISSASIPLLLDKSLEPGQDSYNPPIRPIQTVIYNRPSQELNRGNLMPSICHRNLAQIPSHYRYPIFNRLKNVGLSERDPRRKSIQYISNIARQVISPLGSNILNTNITSVSNDDKTNTGVIQSSRATNSNVVKTLPKNGYSPPIAPIMSHSCILDILDTTDYDFPLLHRRPDKYLEHLEMERIIHTKKHWNNSPAASK